MKKVPVISVAIVMAAIIVPFANADYNFTTININYPGASSTTIGDINNSGHLVGTYIDANGDHHDFYYDGITFTTIDGYPDSICYNDFETSVAGLNDADYIVGRCYSGYSNGYLYDGNSFTPIKYPDSNYTYPRSINNANHIIGVYSPGGDIKSFLYDGTNFTTIEDPSASHTSVLDINDADHIVGEYGAGDPYGSFLYDGSSFTPIVHPDNYFIQAQGINNAGQIVGIYKDDNDNTYGFIFDGTYFDTIIHPDGIDPDGLMNTSVSKISNDGRIIGSYRDSDGTSHQFIATFTNAPPNMPSSPLHSPSFTTNGFNSTLSWSGGDQNAGDTATYDVYFGLSDPPPSVATDYTPTTYDPGTLDYTTTYYWKIVAKDNHGTETIGPIWQFTTVSTDSDSDGMLDTWEVTHFNDLSHDGNSDSDDDGLSDLLEYENNTDPKYNDTDDDGMLDGWEVNNGLNPKVDDTDEDLDGDKFTNAREYQDKTNANDKTSHLILHSGGLPDTGQTKCYDNLTEIQCPQIGEPFYGQDANYNINPPSYIKMDSQGNYLPDSATSWVMVQDNVTGLIWEVKRAKDDTSDYSNPHDADNGYTWYDSNPETNGGDAGTPGDGTDTEDFINSLNSANFGGYSDWRLPTIKELWTIEDYGRYDPAVDSNYFPNTVASQYHSSTTSADINYCAWRLPFQYGSIIYGLKSHSYYVRAVRGEQSGSFDNLIINGDGTVTDTSTGLMWQQATAPESNNWQNTLSYCENMYPMQIYW